MLTQQTVKEAPVLNGKSTLGSTRQSDWTQLPEPLESPFEMLTRVIVRRFPWLLLATLASIAIAYFVAQQSSSRTATATSRAVFVPLPKLPGSEAYRPPDMATISSMIVSSASLSELIEQHELGITATHLANHVAARVMHNSPIIDVQVTWGDPNQAVAIANDLVHISAQQITEHRRKTLAQYLDVTKSSVELASDQVDSSRKKLSTHTVGFSTPLDIDQAADDTSDSNELPLASSRLQRKAKLIEQKALELERESRETILATCLEEVENLRSIVAKNASANGRIDRIKRKFERLSDDQDSFSIWGLKAQRLAREYLGTFSETVDRQLELTNQQLTAFEDDKRHIEMELALAGIGADEINVDPTITGGTSGDSLTQALKTEVDRGIQTQVALADRMRVLGVLESSPFVELRLFEEASLANTTEDSNWKKMFILSLGGCLGLVGLVTLRMEDPHRATAQKAANKLALPLVGELNRNKSDAEGREQTRLLALKVRNQSPRPQSILFSGICSKMNTLEHVVTLAESLQSQGDRVLVIDATGGAIQPTRQSTMSPDYDSKIQRIGFDIDLLRLDEQLPWVIDFDSQSENVIDYARDSYSFILVAGPSTDNTSDCELIAWTVDAVFLCCDKHQFSEFSARQVVQDLQHTRASVPGILRLR